MKRKLLLLSMIILTTIGYTQPPTIEWEKSFGGSLLDVGLAIDNTTDGYIVAGYSLSSDGNLTLNHGNADVLIIKTDQAGTVQWHKTYGGSLGEIARGIEQTSDGGYIVCGYTSSSDGDIEQNHGSSDGWVIKLDAAGVIEWQKTYGGSGFDGVTEIHQTSDGGYIFSGFCGAADGDVTFSYGNQDIRVIKTDASGTIEWQKNIGGSGSDSASTIRFTNDGGYIVAGFTNSTDYDAIGNNGSTDSMFVKMTATGSVEWSTMSGGLYSDTAFQCSQTSDGGYIATGESEVVGGDLMNA
ncbi:MAG TPA: T9SS C-terminal target domain-containing protein, partial [Flavobacterium sp.]|nr:T9SS C-terminal target domain-containing protein [Flavobacterium sp.]